MSLIGCASFTGLWIYTSQSSINSVGQLSSMTTAWNYALVFGAFLGLSTAHHVTFVFCEQRLPAQTTANALLYLFAVGALAAAVVVPAISVGDLGVQTSCIFGLMASAIFAAQFISKPKPFADETMTKQ